ncbi:hypothetical protein VTK56DRAFT_7982 [Thermocarpiscus australiensis]
MPRISIPTRARLPSSLRVDPSNPAVSKILSRLSRSSLLSVALDWLDDNNLPLAEPYLRRTSHDESDEGEDDEADDFYPPARSLEALRELYAGLQARKGSKVEVLDRIMEGDWRHGLSLYQLAMADLQYLYDHPTSQKWAAYRIVPLKTPTDPDGEDPPEVDKESLAIPRFHPSSFLRALQAQVLPDVKAHYTFDTHRTLPLLLLRIFILDSPYSTTRAATSFDAARTVYIAFPHASPYLYISRPQQTLSPAAAAAAASSSSSGGPTTSSSSTAAAAGAAGLGAGEIRSLRALLVEGIPKALSRPHQRVRFALRATALATRNLAELVARRGAGRTNFAGGGWSVYAEEEAKGKGKKGEGKKGEGKKGAVESPLDTVLPSPPLSSSGEGEGEGEGGVVRSRSRSRSPASRREQRVAKRARLVAKARFGETARVGDGKGVERVDVVIEDAFPEVTGEGDDGGEEDQEDSEGQRAGVSARGGRKSQVDADLQRAVEDDSDEDDVDRQRQDEPAQRWRPYVRLTFHGSHVFAGIRQLVECGIIDGERMPGWMTGEEGVTIGAVRNGRIRGHKGSGL